MSAATGHDMDPSNAVGRSADSVAPRPRRRGRLILGVAALVGVGAAAALVGVRTLRSDNGSSAPAATVATGTAQIERRDLIARDTFDGNLTYASARSLIGYLAGTVTAVPATGDTIAVGKALYRVDGRPVLLFDGSTPAWRDLGLGLTEYAVAGQRTGTITAIAAPAALVSPGDVLFRVDGQPTVLMNGNGPAWRALSASSGDGRDILWLERNLRALGYDPDGAMTVDQSWTSATTAAVDRMQVATGATEDGVLDLGDIVFRNGAQRVAVPSAEASATSPAVGASIQPGQAVLGLRALADRPDPGVDVRQLEKNLVKLGYDPKTEITVDAKFDTATDAAIRRMQKAHGLVVDGIVHKGDVAFLPGAQRVAAAAVGTGSSVQPGAPILDLTSTQQIVSLDLAATQSGKVKVGDPVVVTLPDGANIDGTIATIGAVAAAATAASDGNAASTTPTINVQIGLARSDSVGLDQAPVSVGITSKSSTGVLAVPVTALLAVSGGGYAVERVAADGAHAYVAVQPGVFADGLVEVTGDLTEGDTVVVPK